MSDDLQQRYAHLSHAQLYNQLMAGDPEQVENLASKWSSLETTIDGLARSLESDLDKLKAGWSSAAGVEFSRRLGLIRAFANDLAGEFGSMRRGLSLMATPLRKAQQQAEHPDETDDHDKTIKGAVTGGIIAGPAGALVGGYLGHRKDQEEQEKAHRRMVQLVAGVAVEYGMSDHSTWPTQVKAPPPDLPGTIEGSTSPSAGPQVSQSSAAPGTGTGTGGGRTASAASTPTFGTGGPGQVGGTSGSQGFGTAASAVDRVGRDDYGTSLAGAGGGNLGGWAAGAGGATLAAGGAIRSGAPAGIPSAQQPAPTSGILGIGGGISGAGAEAKAATSAGRGLTGQRGGADVAARADANRAAAGTRSGARPDGEQDEHLTWLTEDEMVWHGDEQGAPPVLGGPA
ncbi:MAG TPA: WXG100 family type VII secretion target [Micromonosporaceae bacterium]|nr:WXG100 family type VII secretion target [Micromonosporaceae bacterium]